MQKQKIEQVESFLTFYTLNTFRHLGTVTTLSAKRTLEIIIEGLNNFGSVVFIPCPDIALPDIGLNNVVAFWKHQQVTFCNLSIHCRPSQVATTFTCRVEEIDNQLKVTLWVDQSRSDAGPELLEYFQRSCSSHQVWSDGPLGPRGNGVRHIIDVGAITQWVNHRDYHENRSISFFLP